MFKVAELYEITKKWDTVANTVPHVVDRLVALQELHEQGINQIIKYFYNLFVLCINVTF